MQRFFEKNYTLKCPLLTNLTGLFLISLTINPFTTNLLKMKKILFVMLMLAMVAVLARGAPPITGDIMKYKTELSVQTVCNDASICVVNGCFISAISFNLPRDGCQQVDCICAAIVPKMSNVITFDNYTIRAKGNIWSSLSITRDYVYIEAPLRLHGY